jgi:diguanylate cyclase (GGDEF)-like protein
MRISSMPNSPAPRNLEHLGFTPREQQIPALPSGMASILLLMVMLYNGLTSLPMDAFSRTILLAYCIGNSLALAYFHFFLVTTPRMKPTHVWAYAVIEVAATILLANRLPQAIDPYIGALMILLCITASIIADRAPAHFILAGMTFALVIFNLEEVRDPTNWSRLLGATLVAAVSNEAIHQFRTLTARDINRLKVINEFSRKITSSLEMEQVLALLNETIPNALPADSYFFGLAEGDNLRLSLLYDEGELFKDVTIKLEGTLSGWVIRNRKELFLPDLRRDPALSGVDRVIVGQEKPSLSWMGVPINGIHVQGVIAFASYRPNAFNRGDMELMNNMAQHAALALDNTFHHAHVERQSQLNSLTGVYNHGHFLNLLKRYAEEAEDRHTPLSLIMLDVDYFKQYNDTYGHLAGDEILTALCNTITSHIKHEDIVGRWGGEEFAVVLLNANGRQANQVAQRIHESMAAVCIKSVGRRSIPAPTLSQGIAQFPDEADEIMKLVDLADRRLYIAKERGRNQIEPSPEHWEKMRV